MPRTVPFPLSFTAPGAVPGALPYAPAARAADLLTDPGPERGLTGRTCSATSAARP